ncbi:MAG: valine--tRNA ligase, partial [Chitinophagales bacterium]
VMEISKTYDPAEIEDKWYAHWMSKNYFRSVPDGREPYTIVIPPPNVTGVLHMGHMLNNTLQDLLIRRARMMGKNACWVPGTDHASISTEAKVVGMLRERGIKKSDLTREEFLNYAWEWKEKYGGIILQQLKKLGASCDWERTSFTMDRGYYEDVVNVFIELYNRGHIYRGLRMINWDPEAKTALSNEEVFYKDITSKLHYVKYQIKDSDDFITVATTRPETILGDTAIAVHPDDERYHDFIGKTALVPIINREIPIISDTYVEKEFGTGALKVTPAHDENDYQLGLKHNLKIIDTFNEDGTLNENAEILIGEDRFVARKKMVALLEENGQLTKIEDLKNSVGFSERTDAVVEKRLSMQWFLSMKEISEPALQNVVNGNIKLHPSKYINTYKHWMENVRDWCISRQLWWGHRIPAWYNSTGDFVVAKTKTEAEKLFAEKNHLFNDIYQDPDVLDTWASSWLWPISVFNGLEDKDGDIKYYYPTNTLVTAPEILFFWVARMIIAGYLFEGDKPFTDVYLTGIVRDKQRRKMSKSLGNSPDPLDLIAKYGADAVRMGMLLCSPAGNDIIYDEKLIEQGRNFNNKIWNVLRLIKGWEVTPGNNEKNKAAILWFESKLNRVIRSTNEHFDNFRISDALMELYSFVWDDFCS